MLMGIPPHDYDVATDAKPEDVMRLFHRVVPTGIAHGTVTVHLMGCHIETTTFRTESGYSDGRHPDSVAYAASIEDDLSRRDFTMNAVAVDLADEKLVDPFSGRGDIKEKLIRAVGNPHERFGEDGLRPVRAIRFAQKVDDSFIVEFPRSSAQTADEASRLFLYLYCNYNLRNKAFVFKKEEVNRKTMYIFSSY